MKLLLTLASTLFLASCSTKFTEAQRQSIPTVAIARTTMAKDAYKKPNGGSAGARQTADQAAIGANAGAIGGALGSLIGEGIAAVQDSRFQHDHTAEIAIVEKNTPHDIDQPFFSAMTTDLKKDAFFGSRISPTSGNVFTSSVTSYGLQRNDIATSGSGTLHFSPNVTVKVELTTSAGKKLVAGYAHGSSTNSRPISEYAKSPALLRKDFHEAAVVAEGNFMKQMAKMTAK